MDTVQDRSGTFQKLEKRLSSASVTARLISLLHGIGDLLVVGFAFFLFSFLTDFLISDLPALVRQIMLGSGIIVIGYTFWSVIVHPQFHSLSNRDIAAELEGTYPELNDRLISAIDLKERMEDDSNLSRHMIESLIQDLDQSIHQVSPFRIFSLKPVLKKFGTGLICLGLFLLFLWSFPEESTTWMVRLSGQNNPWPQATRIALTSNDTVQVVEGNDFTVQATVDPTSKRIPNSAQIYISRDGKPSKTIEINRQSSPSDTPIFAHEFQNVQDPFQYTIRAGDGETSEGSVTVVERPRITELSIWYDYPEYTGKTDTSDEDPVSSRELSAPFDTIASVRASVPSSVHTARAYFDSGQKTTDLPVSLSTSKKGDRKTVQTELQLKKNGDLFFELFMKQTNQASDQTPCSAPFAVCSSRFSVKAQMDQPPQVKLLYPGKNKFATPRAKIPIRSEVTDDYGISSIQFIQRINENERKTITYDSAQNDSPYKNSTIRSEYQLLLEPLKLERGDTLYYAISATDVGDTNTEPSRSKRYRFSIISPGRFEVKLQNLQEQIRERLANLRKDQKGTRTRLQNTRNELSSNSSNTLSTKLNRTLGKRRNKQRSLNQRMKRINNELLRINRDAKFNALWDKKSRTTLSDIYKNGRRIKTDLMGEASKSIAKATTVTDPVKRTELIDNALSLQERAIQQLDALLQQMGAWYNYADIIHEWKKVLDNLKQLRQNKGSISPG